MPLTTNDRYSMKILFVCMGNICRSPTAEGIFRHKVEQAGLAEQVFIDSAGTTSHHSGESPDPRSVEAAASAGYDLGAQRARGVTDHDFAEFDKIVAMDKQNMKNLLSRCPEEYQYKLSLLLQQYAPETGYEEVPDPYYGGQNGFKVVIDLVEQACTALLEQVEREL